MSYEYFIGLRYLLSKKSNKLISVITLISILGVTLGVMALIVVVSVVSGFENYFQERILGNNSHLVVHMAGKSIKDYRDIAKKILAVKGVKGVTPLIYNEVLVSNSSNQAAGVVIYGVDPETFGSASTIPKKLQSGDIKLLSHTEDGKERRGQSLPGLLVGRELAENELFLFPSSTVTIISPYGELSPFGMGPKMRKFEVVGVFQTGLYEYDSKYIYTDIKTLQDFFMMGDEVSSLQVSIDNLKDTENLQKKISAVLGEGFYVRTWKELNRDIFAAFKLEKTTFFIVLAMIVLVASFNIIGTLNMTVMEKGKEISIIKSLGATSKGIMKIFMTVGSMIGVVGTVLGLGLGYIVCILLRDYVKFPLNANVYQLSELPVKMHWLDFLIVAICALAISFLATVYPSLKASKLDPCEGIRYE